MAASPQNGKPNSSPSFSDLIQQIKARVAQRRKRLQDAQKKLRARKAVKSNGKHQ